jgi:hypothetical protein
LKDTVALKYSTLFQRLCIDHLLLASPVATNRNPFPLGRDEHWPLRFYRRAAFKRGITEPKAFLIQNGKSFSVDRLHRSRHFLYGHLGCSGYAASLYVKHDDRGFRSVSECWFNRAETPLIDRDQEKIFRKKAQVGIVREHSSRTCESISEVAEIEPCRCNIGCNYLRVAAREYQEPNSIHSVTAHYAERQE